MQRLTGLLGIACLLLAAWLLSEHRRRVPVRVVAAGLGLQLAVAVLLLRVPVAADAFGVVAGWFTRVIESANAGSRFIFGGLADGSQPWGVLFFVKVLPIIIFFAALMGVLYRVGVMQLLIRGMAFVLRRSLGVTGAEALAAAANVFVGQTEAPLCVKPFIERMTRSQLMLIMTAGFATIAGSVLGAFVSYIGAGDPERTEAVTRHLLTASLISAPGAFVMAKLMVPETGAPPDEAGLTVGSLQQGGNTLDAASRGATDGLRLAANVAAMLIAFVSLIALVNWPLGAIGEAAGLEGGLSLQRLFGWALTPLAWVIGVPAADAGEVASLIGLSLVATEFVAYDRLSGLIAGGEITGRGAVIATYALCGFANLPSIGIQIGGLSAMAPSRRTEIAGLGFRAMLAGAMTCWMTACVAGLIAADLPVEAVGAVEP